MKYAMCPKCGRRLCKGENGTKVEMECPKCGEFASVKHRAYHFGQNAYFVSFGSKQLYATTFGRRHYVYDERERFGRCEYG